MTDKITKLLNKLPPKQLRIILSVLQQIASNDMKSLDVKTLKGYPDLYRVRVGDYRIIFKLQADKKPRVIYIAKRNEKTYKGL